MPVIFQALEYVSSKYLLFQNESQKLNLDTVDPNGVLIYTSQNLYEMGTVFISIL